MRRPRHQAPLKGALNLVRTPSAIYLLARTIAPVIVLVCLGLALAPWVQTVQGTGQVIADAPLERTQPIEAPIKGRLLAWHVSEGKTVAKGELIATIGDNDPAYIERLQQSKIAAELSVHASETEIAALQVERSARQEAKSRAVAAAKARIREAEHKVLATRHGLEAARAGDKAARLDLSRRTTLEEKGLRSRRDLESATLRQAKNRVAVAKKRAELAGSEATVLAKKSDLAEKIADADAKIAKVEATISKARSTKAKAQSTLAKASVDLARQHRGVIRAPRDGVIMRLLVQADTELVKVGDPVAILVPSITGAAAEIWLDGNDAALVESGRPVRLQFEGWPAFQFSGWPNAATGTFGGRVAYVDASATRSGKFRVLVRPDPDEAAWPSPGRLRQGTRVNGWVQLNEVRLGYEVWRQLNAFPPLPTDLGSKPEKKK